MRLLKIILVFFAIYFIRRFIQMYQAMKQVQEQQLKAAHEEEKSTKEQTVINAEFKVMD